jgi:hypothetical protein
MDYRKALIAKLAGHPAVSSSVVGDFLIPPGTVVLWCRVTTGAAMPKTSVDEDRQFESRDHQVWSTRQRSHIAFETDLFGLHHFTYTQFYASPLGADSAHAFGDGF